MTVPSTPSAHVCVAVLMIFLAALSGGHSWHTRPLGRLTRPDGQNDERAAREDSSETISSDKHTEGKSGGGDVADKSVFSENVQSGTISASMDFVANVSFVSQSEVGTDPALELFSTHVSSVSLEGNVTNSMMEPFITSNSSMSQIENVTDSAVEYSDKNITSVSRKENVTNSTLEHSGKDITPVSRGENVTDSTLEHSDKNVSSLSLRENMTDSTLEHYGKNVSSVSRRKDMTDLTLALFGQNISSLSLRENMTDSMLKMFGQNISSVSLGENVTDSMLEMFGQNISSVSLEENVTDVELDALTQNDSFLIQNDSLLIQNDSFLIQNDSFLIQNDSFLIQNDSFLIQNDSFLIQNENKYSEHFEQNSEPIRSHNSDNSSKDFPMYTNTTIGSPHNTHDKNQPTHGTHPNVLPESLSYFEEDGSDYDDNEPHSLHPSSEDDIANLDPFVKSGCVACQKRSIDRRFRILQFKNQILQRLHMTSFPNTTGVSVPKFPALAHLYEMDADLMSDSHMRHGQGEDNAEYEDDIIVKTERVFVAAKEAPLALHLNLTDSVYFPPAVQLLTSDIRSAYLWFYIQKHHTPPSYVRIESIIPQNKPGAAFITKKVLSLKLAKERAFGWKRVDLRDTLRQWLRHPMTNFGLIVKAEDAAGNNLIVLPPAPDVDKGYEPWLDTKIVEPKHNVRRRRSESLMCVENSTDTRCCRHPLLVGFAEFGWDWIIAPTHVNADYCTGECRMTMQDNTPYSWVNQQMAGTSSCCTPTKLSPLPLLYFDESMNVVYQILQNMKVDKCGCA